MIWINPAKSVEWVPTVSCPKNYKCVILESWPVFAGKLESQENPEFRPIYTLMEPYSSHLT